MKTFTLDLWEGFDYAGAGDDGFRPTLDAYVIESAAPRPAVLVLPGSGYFRCAPKEGEPIALQFNAKGYHAFVLWYSCAPRRHPVPVRDCARALTLIRQNAAEWRVDPAKVAMLGFSAGGHLALSEALFYDKDFTACPGVDVSRARPDLLILCYPVVTSGPYAHPGSFECLLGDKKDDPALRGLMSLENQIRPDTPPVFLWHTYTDQAVPVENSLFLAAALRRAGVPLELHIFPEGQHGLALATRETMSGDSKNLVPAAAQWMPLCAQWLGDRGG